MDLKSPLHVVGFSGAVYPGATAICSPVFERDGRYFSGDPDVTPNTTYVWSEIEQYEQRGLLTLIAEKRVRQKDFVFVYAHEAFVRPSSTMYDLRSSLGDISWDERASAHCGYVHIRDGEKLFENWAKQLIRDAEDAFHKGKYERAYESAMRARFTTTPERPELHRRLFIYAAAARRGMELDTFGIMRYAQLDFSKADVASIALEAMKLFSRSRFGNDRPLQRRLSVQFATAA